MTVWECDAGRITGVRVGGLLRAGGIPYARAERRRPPEPEPPSAEVDGTGISPACPQAPVPLLDRILGGPVEGLVADERCQRLTVTAPEHADGTAPVLVWLHGGSYTSGAADVPFYDPSALVREQQVVVVGVTYRLGLFGYLSADGSPGNLGLLDQLEALHWVQRNIAAFGGDPGNVTVVGHSAGGDAAAHLMLCGAPFRRAIVQSAPLGISRGRSRMYAAMARRASGLDTAPAEALAAMSGTVTRNLWRYGLRAGMPFGTEYGVHPLPPEPEVDQVWRDAAEDYDVLIGRTAREARLFLAGTPAARSRRLEDALTHRLYGAGVETFARRHTAGGGRGYTYLCSWAPPNGYAGAHTTELPLLFPDPAWQHAPLLAGADWPEVEEAGRELRRVWAGFARTGVIEQAPAFLDVRPM